MKELGCKILAAIFIIAIVFSLFEMRRDFLRPHYVDYNDQHIELSSPIQLYDHVLIKSEKKIGYVLGITNETYYVVFHDDTHPTIKSSFPREDLRKIIISIPHK